jgi:twitching motility two-component system response regulator PilH
MDGQVAASEDSQAQCVNAAPSYLFNCVLMIAMRIITEAREMPSVIIADDSMLQRFEIGKVAKELGFEVIEAVNGRQCLERLRESLPDALLLDLNMPDVDGNTVLEQLRNRAPNLPVAVITADIQDTTRERVMALGANILLNKPLQKSALRAFLEGVLA